MKITKIIGLIGIFLMIWSAGCARTVPIKNHEKFWWIEGNTRVKPRGSNCWIEVVKVEKDSVYGHYLNSKSDTLVVVPLDSLERIEKVEPNDFVSFLQGILIGGVAGGIIFS